MNVAILLVGVAGLALAAPSGAATGVQSFPSATDVDTETVKKTTALIEQFIPPLIKSIGEGDGNGDVLTRINSIVESSLVLGREAALVNNNDANQEAVKQIDAARESIPIIMDLVRATIKTFQNNNTGANNFGFNTFTPFRQ